MKRRIGYWVVLLCLAGVVSAQPGASQKAGTIIGHVFDAVQGEPVDYANIVLRSLPDSAQVSGAVTDKAGLFRLDGVKPGRYYVEVSFIGYRDRVTKEVEVTGGAPLDIGRIDLEQKPVPMKGVEASAEKPAISYQVDKKVVDVSKLPNAASGTAVDALRDVPSVKVDIEDNVTLRGSSNFKLLIDGKPTLLDPNEVLKQTPAQTVDKIEIITNPSAKYEPDGAAGIINLLLKKQKGSGNSALLDANGGMRGSCGGDALLSHRQGIVNAYAGGNIGRYTSDWTATSDNRTFLANETLLTTGTGSGSWVGLFGAGRAGLDLTFSPRDKSSVSGRFGGFHGNSGGTFRKADSVLPRDSMRYRFYRTYGLWDYTRQYSFITADHEHDFDTAGHKLTLNAYLVNYGGGGISENAGLEENAAMEWDTTGGQLADQRGPQRRANIELDYTKPLRKSDKLEAGYQSRFERTDQNYKPYQYDSTKQEWDLLSSHPYTGTQTIHSLFVTYTWSWGNLGLQPGLRGEYGDRTIAVTDTNTVWKITRWDYFPSFHATYGLGSGRQFTASYSRRIDRPDAWYLRPFQVWQDDHTVNAGNPELRPSYTNSWEAGCEVPFGANSVTAEAYYRTTTDIYEWVTTKYPQDSTVLLETADNVGHDLSLGCEATANVSPCKWFTAYLTADVYHYREEANQAGFDTVRSALAWSSSANLTFRPAANTQIQLNGDFSGPNITATSTSDGWFGTNLAVKQTLLKRALSVTLRLSNLLGPRIQHSTSQGKGFLNRSSYRTEGLTVSLAVSYNFNNFKFNQSMQAGEGIEQGGGGGAGGPQH